MAFQLFTANNIEKLKSIPDNTYDCIGTDAPYGLGKEPDPIKLLTAWIKHGYLEIKGGGFMGKEWDAFVPQPIFWKECFRVLKPGGYLFSFFGTRTYDYGTMAIRLAGFEIRDCIQWIYGSGFPKSRDISKAIDEEAGAEREIIGKNHSKGIRTGQNNYVGDKYDVKGYDITTPSTDEAKQWQGYGTALKPANEPICIARKPISESTIAKNVIKHGAGAINIDAGRIDFVNEDDLKSATFGTGINFKGGNFASGRGTQLSEVKNIEANASGRWPANVVLGHHSDCVYLGTKVIKNKSGSITGDELSHTGDENSNCYSAYDRQKFSKYGDANGNEVIENYQCVADCPIRMLNNQTADIQPSKGNYVRKHGDNQFLGALSGGIIDNPTGITDYGGASRFFYCAKASPNERKEYNNHPTVKPLALMRWLVRIFCPKGGKLLDPFVGSGTTVAACEMEGIDSDGIDMDPTSISIAEKRIPDLINEARFGKDYNPNQYTMDFPE